MRRLTVLLCGWLALGVAIPALGQDQARVRAQVDRNEMADGEDLRLTVEIVGQALDKVGPPDMSVLDDFEVSGGPSVSTRYQWVNGVSSSSKTYTFFLTPKRIGKLSVPSLGILVQGGTYRTQAIDVTVTPRGAIRSPMRPGPPIPRPAPSQGGAQRGRPGGAPGRESLAPAALRIRCEVDTRTAYVGQQVTLKVVLDTQTEVLHIGYQETPTFPGFWTEEVKLPDQLDVRRVQIDGEPWSEITLMKRALFPTTAGTLTIPPVAWQIQVRRRSTDALESFFFTPTETVNRRSDPITITALPVPAAGRPAGFSGAVGEFNLSVVADRQASRVNDAIGVKVKVSGEGNLGAVQAPEIADLADFKLFEPKVSTSTTMQGDRLRSEKTWDYVVIPLAQGTQTVPPIRFTYFDPRAAVYRTVSSGPLSVQVGKGEEGGGSSLPVVSQSDVRLLRRDIHYLKLAPDGLHDRSRPLYRTPIFVALILLPVVADLALLGWARTRDDSPGAARSRRERRARSAARRRLRAARRLMAPSTSRAFYASVAQAMTDYIGDKFGAAGTGLTHERIEELLATHGAAEDLRAAYHRCLEACDYARFAPSSSDTSAMQQTLTSAEETLVSLERTIPR